MASTKRKDSKGYALRVGECQRKDETNLKVIQDIMGHTDISTTMDIYAEATDVKKKEAIKALENNSDIFQEEVLARGRFPRQT